MSASKIPTFNPLFAKEIARLLVTVDLPTPPLPEAIRIIFFKPTGLLLFSILDDVFLLIFSDVRMIFILILLFISFTYFLHNS